MTDILLEFPINVPPTRVYEAVSTPGGLDVWWTKQSSGRPETGEEYALSFGPQFDWRAKVTKCVAPSAFELTILQADRDWNGTRVGFELAGQHSTTVRFCHRGWPEANAHWRISCYCWALYWRLLRRYLEHGESVPYERRLDV